MHSDLTVTLTGTAPCVMHNGQLSDPLNKYSRAIKEITGKRKKTDADHEETARLEWIGSLYVNEKGQVVWPSENIVSMLSAAARKRKEGQQAKSAILCDGDFVLEYPGAKKDVNELWKDENFRLRVSVRVSQARVMRTRPIFRNWKLTTTVQYDPDLVNKKTVMEWFEIAGQQIGLSDWRPKFGRFVVNA
jgi:hypothetical protein